MAKTKVINGINVDQLLSTIKDFKQKPEFAQFTFRAKNSWVEGTHNRAIVKDYYGALREDDLREAMVFDIDEPRILGGKNKGANPVEYLLVALSGCITTSIVAHAAAKGIEIKKISSRYEGDLDLRGFLGISDDVPVGYQTIRVFFTIEADVSNDVKEELIKMGQKYSPVYNTITNKTSVIVGLDR